VTYLDSKFTEILYHQPGHLRSVNVIREIDGYILTGGQDGRICIWDLDLEKEVGCIFAHNSGITDIQKLNTANLVLSTALDLDLKAWALDNFEKIEKQKAHLSSIIGAKPLDNLIISAGRDGQLRKWIIENGNFKLLAKTKILTMSQILLLENRILISCQEGDKFTLDIENLKEDKGIFASDSKVIKAIKRASKYIKEFENKDPYTILFQISRRNGFPAISSTVTNDKIIIGHEFGFVSIWQRDTLKSSKVFFAHGKHITGVEVIDDILYSVSLDSTISMFDIESQKPIKSINLPSKPLSFLKTSKSIFIVGLETGELLVFDKQLNQIGSQENIKLITGSAITPNYLAFALNSGHIVLLNNENLETMKRKKIHEDTILGLFFYNDKLISIGGDKKVIILNSELEVTNTLEFEHKISNPRQVKHYITLTTNHVLDLRNTEIIKGEVSKETEDELNRVNPISFELIKGDIRIKINNIILQEFGENNLQEMYKGEIRESIDKLSKSKEKSFYKQENEYFITSKQLKLL
jgi:WD40 repeat protein